MKLFNVNYLSKYNWYEVAENESQAIKQAFKKFCKHERVRTHCYTRRKLKSNAWSMEDAIKYVKENHDWAMEQFEYFWADEIFVEGYKINVSRA